MSEYWKGPTVKVAYCGLRKQYETLVYGNPYQQVYSGTKEDCMIIAKAYIKVGYKFVSPSE